MELFVPIISWSWSVNKLFQVGGTGMVFGSQAATGYAQGSHPGCLHMQIGGGLREHDSEVSHGNETSFDRFDFLLKN